MWLCRYSAKNSGSASQPSPDWCTPPTSGTIRPVRSVSASYCRAIVQVALTHGVPREVLHASAEIPEVGRVPLDRLYTLLEVAAAYFDEPDELTLLIVRNVKPEAYEVLGYMVSTAETLGAVLQSLVRFGRLVTDEPIDLVVEGDRARFLYFPVGTQRPGHRYAAVLMLVDAVQGLSRLAGKQVCPVRVVVPGGHLSATLVQTIGTDEVVDGWPPSIEFDVDVLNTPVTTANAPVYAYFEGLAHAALAATEEPLAARVRKQILRSLPHTAATVDDIARRLGMSSRSLQRALRSESLSFSTMLEEVRRESASFHLGHGRTVTEVALLLGYSDARAFRRAYRRWHGRSPAQADEVVH